MNVMQFNLPGAVKKSEAECSYCDEYGDRQNLISDECSGQRNGGGNNGAVERTSVR